MRYLVFFILIFPTIFGFSQDRKIDQLEILYDQGYYSKVLKKSSRLLANPAYDYSGLPSFYKSLSLFRMADNDDWFKRHAGAIGEAVGFYDTFLESERVEDYIFSHYNEIARLKFYLTKLEKKFRKMRLNGSADEIKVFTTNQLNGIKSKLDLTPTKEVDKVEKDDEIATNEVVKSEGAKFRDKLVVYAKSLVGVKYKWAGTDKSGFDCSGFVGYVHKKYGINIPRTASMQMANAKKVKLPEAQKGDLIFFSSGGNISHVGLVVTDKGKDLAMVHASTSKGVIVTIIEQSTYWKPKLKGAGTYL